ncbi:hypothetical protein [Nocardioides sp.]|uniref:hypothetical protein n=1 Tax=Nocardioides sp. TaxID=35761 RepID=UPI0035B091DC
MNPHYERWNRALSDRFLQGRGNEPLYLYVDDAVLQEVAGEAGADSGEAVDDFVAAVKSTLDDDQPFAPWERRSRVLSSSETPTHLAVLCFLVLVAVEREETHFSYYPGLNRALGRPADGGAPPGFHKHVDLLFTRFNEWLERSGHGSPTAAPTPSFPHVSWPLSQAVVRPADRALLVRLFAALGLEPRQGRSAESLAKTVLPRLWTQAESGSRTRLLDLAQQHRDIFESTVLQLYLSWDGSLRAQSGPKFSNVRLCHEETSGDWWFLGPAVPGTDGHRWTVGSASGMVRAIKGFEATPSDLWTLVGSGTVGAVDDGPTLRSPARDVRWLSTDMRAGGWAEVGQRDHQADQLAIAERPAAGSLSAVPGVESRGTAPSGASIFFVGRGVAVDEPDGRSGPLRPSLRGGLRLRAATSSFLLSEYGAPEILGCPGERANVGYIEHRVVEGTVSIDGPSLGQGDHEVRCDGGAVRFRLVDRLLAPGTHPADPPWYDDLPPSPRIEVPHRAGGPVWVVGPDGALQERGVAEVRWLQDLGLDATAVDVTGMVGSTQFTPLFVVSSPTPSRVWVTPVPQRLRRPNLGAERRSYDRLRARSLVSRLLTDVGPPEIQGDREWKKVLAAVMREVHR